MALVDQIGAGFKAIEALVDRLDTAMEKVSAPLLTSRDNARQSSAGLGSELDRAVQRVAGLSIVAGDLAASLDSADHRLRADASGAVAHARDQNQQVATSTAACQKSVTSLQHGVAACGSALQAQVKLLGEALLDVQESGKRARQLWHEQQTRAATHLQGLAQHFSAAAQALLQALQLATEAFSELAAQLKLDAMQTVPRIFAPLHQYVSETVPAQFDEVCRHSEQTVDQALRDYVATALAEADVFAQQMAALYASVGVFERETLPERVRSVLQSDVLPVLLQLAEAVRRTHRSTHSAGNIAKEFGRYLPMIQFCIQYFSQLLGASMGAGADGGASTADSTSAGAGEGAPPPEIVAFEEGSAGSDSPESSNSNSPFFRPPSEERDQWHQRGDGSWVHEEPAAVTAEAAPTRDENFVQPGSGAELTPDGMVSQLGYQTLDPKAPMFRPPEGHESEWFQKSDLTWVQGAEAREAQAAQAAEAHSAPLSPAPPQGGGMQAPAAAAQGSSSGPAPQPLLGAVTNAPPTGAAASALHTGEQTTAAADPNTARQVSPPPDQYQAVGTPSSPSHSGTSPSPPSAPGGSGNSTIGGFEDNTREDYEKMRGGQNTPQETLAKLRQETIDKANKLHPEWGQQAPASAGGASVSRGGQAGGGGYSSGSQQTIGGFEDNTREVYEKMRGGQNTPQETLAKLRQETIDKANKLHPEWAQHAPSPASQGGGSAGGPSGGPGHSSGAHQTIGGFEDNTREVYEKMRGGQNTPQETLAKLRQETIDKANKLHPEWAQQAPPPASQGGGSVGGHSSGGHSSGSHQTIGGFEDNTREVYEKMRGGQNTPQETLAKLRQETIDKANKLHPEWAQHAPNPPSQGGGSAGGHSSGGHSSGSHQTIGGFEDNTREVYEKMRGGQNTPQETLAKLRQETIDKANRLHPEWAQQTPSAAPQGGGPTGGSSGATPSSGSHQTIGGFEDNTREVYDKMRGGQNTPKETLERMRQETIDKANRLRKEQHP